MSDRLTDAELGLLEGLHGAATPPPWRWCGSGVRADAGDVCYGADGIDAGTIAAAHNVLPSLLAEVREYRAREAAHRAALDTLVDGEDR